MCSKVARAFVQNLFGGAGRSAVGDKYHYHGYKMDRLYHAMHVTESGPVPLDDLVRRCTQLDRSLANKYSDLVGRTAVTLLKSEMVCGHGVQLTGRGLNARKTMYVALDFIDLTLNAYEPDYDEACREIQQLKSLSVTKKKGSIYLFFSFYVKILIDGKCSGWPPNDNRVEYYTRYNLGLVMSRSRYLIN